jgi:anti-sigma-K factor RskA
MSEIDIHHLAAAYALDALDERERSAFEAHYPSCEVCRGDVLDFRATLAQMTAATAAAPPPSVKSAVMAEIAQTRQLSPLVPAVVSDLAERRRRRQRVLGAFLAAAAAVAVFVAGGVLLNGSEEPSYADDLSSILDGSDGRVAVLDATDSAAGTLMVAWSGAGERAVLVGRGLAPAPDGSAYELWFIGDEGPLAMGVLDPAAGGRIGKSFDVGSTGTGAAPQAWGITLEPEGGSPVPTGEVLYLGEVQ